MRNQRHEFEITKNILEEVIGKNGLKSKGSKQMLHSFQCLVLDDVWRCLRSTL